MPDPATVHSVALAVCRNVPYVRCFPCLASQVGLLEKDAREAAQLLVVRDDFCIARRRCQICARTDDALVNGKEGRDASGTAGAAPGPHDQPVP
jgi:hypothetical protein